MSRVISVTNQKGGVGKTTTAVNVAAYIASLGNNVLLLDMDPQANATSGLGIDKKIVKNSVYEILINDTLIDTAIVPTKVKSLALCPASIRLAGAEVELVNAIAREAKLKTALQPVRCDFDYIIIDCPPSLGLLTINALTASDSVLIPVQCEYYALEGISQLMDTLQLVRRHLNPHLELEGIILTMFSTRTNLAVQVANEVRKYFKDDVFRNVIPKNVRLSEAPSHGLPIILYDPKSKGAECYRELSLEILEAHEKEVKHE